MIFTFQKGKQYKFVLNNSVPITKFVKNEQEYHTFTYTMDSYNADVVFKVNNEEVTSLEHIDIAPVHMPLFYSLTEKPTTIAITLDTNSLYPNYVVDFS